MVKTKITIFKKLIKENTVKRLIIINGVTGALGSACLALCSRNPENTIYGWSRKGLPYMDFLVSGIMPDVTLICSVGKEDLKGYHMLLDRINFSLYEKVIYIHALGVYPFEISPEGTITVTDDHDKDGINDLVTKLSHDFFLSVLNKLIKKSARVQALIFGGLVDKHEPLVHQSWWKTMKKIKARCIEVVSKNKKVSVMVLNISSVICPNELITRPFVFRDTDAKSCFWLMPHEVAEEVDRLTTGDSQGFYECELFHPSGYYRPGYYADENFTVRKKRELGIL
jgi:hypothetical protein